VPVPGKRKTSLEKINVIINGQRRFIGADGTNGSPGKSYRVFSRHFLSPGTRGGWTRTRNLRMTRRVFYLCATAGRQGKYTNVAGAVKW
jgi:hypothetical protein